MFTASPPAQSLRLTWRLAILIVALQIAMSAGLYFVNARTEDIPGRQVSQVLAAQLPTNSYVELPDAAFSFTDIPREECCTPSGTVYRTTLTAQDAAQRYPAILIVSAHDNALAYVDGALIGGVGRADGPPPAMGRRPQLLRIPSELARPGARLDILVQRAVGFGHLRPFHIGGYDQLYPSFLMLRLLRADLPFANAVVGAFVAFFCFCAAPLFGARALLFSLGALATAWVGQHVGLLLTTAPWGANANNGVYLVSFMATLLCAVWFFIEWTSVFAQPRSPRHPLLALALDPWGWRARRWLAYSVGALIAATALFTSWRLSFDPMVGTQDINRVTGLFGIVAMAFCAVRIIIFYARAGFRHPIEASAFVFVIVAAIADIIMVQFFGTYGVFLGAAVAFFPLALLVSLAARARGIFEAATATADKLNGLVALREREIRATLAEIQRRERSEMLVEERSRIMRDMHDGIGGQLIGLILQARSGKLSDHALVGGLEQSLDDLRMVVDSLEQGEGSLTGALGAFRARIEPRCEAADAALVWAIEDVGDTPDIGPDKTLQIYRILQEACTNALKHGAPKRLSVSLQRISPSLVEIALADDGKGFDAAMVSSGRGIANMRTRAQRLGAALDVTSSPNGSRVALTLNA